MEQEIDIIDQYIRETEERLALKAEQREKNARENIIYPDECFLAKLDSSIKKNSTFVRKIKNMTETQRDQLIKDINNLNLTKFISEIASSIVEAKLKLSDVPTVIEICSRLHQRYPNFSKLLLNQWIKYFPSVKKQTTHDSINTSNIPLQSTSGSLLYISTSTSPTNSGSSTSHNSVGNPSSSTVAGLSSCQPSDTIFNPSKMRIDLRLFAELISSGIFSPKDSLGVLGNLLTYLTMHDKNSYQNASAILSFCRSCGDDYAGLISSRMHQLADKYDKIIPRSDFLPSEKQRALRSCLKDYYQVFCSHNIGLHEELNHMDLQNKRVITTKGELSRDRKEKFESKQLECQKSFNIVQQLADILDEKLPDLPVMDTCKDESHEDESTSNELFRNGSDPNLSSIWEDDDTRNFYENLLDLKVIFPQLVNKISSLSLHQKEGADTKDATTSREEKSFKESQNINLINTNGEIEINLDSTEDHKQQIDMSNKSLNYLNDLIDEPNSDSNEFDENKSERDDRSPINSETFDRSEEDLQTLMDYADDDSSNSQMKRGLTTFDDVLENASSQGDVPSVTREACSQYIIATSDQQHIRMTSETYFSKLANCVNRDMIDKAAVDFIRYFNTKFGRKKLIKTLFSVQRTRLDLLPFYARLIATIHPLVPSLAPELVMMLKHDFRMLFRKKDQINIESKVKNVRFIGELVKFRLFSKQEALTCLKILLSDFTHHHIEMCCNLLETCGRLLYRSQESHYKIKLLLEQMMRKKLLLSVDSKYITMIENAYYFSKPPEVVAQQLEIPPIQTYIKYLLYDCLSRSTIDKVSTQLRKLDWHDKDLARFAIKCLIEVYNVKFYNIRYVAAVLATFNRYHSWVSTIVIDGVVEDILLMMEINQANYNQRRIPMIRFLGELYNYKLAESSLVFKILYSLITYGIYYPRPGDTLLQIQLSSLDSPDNLFRIKLVCDLLESCGQYLGGLGQEKKKLDCYLLFFQRYYWCKRYIYTLHPYCMAMSDNQFPVSIEYLFKDTITTIRPKFSFATSYELADKHVQNLIDEMMIIQ